MSASVFVSSFAIVNWQTTLPFTSYNVNVLERMSNHTELDVHDDYLDMLHVEYSLAEPRETDVDAEIKDFAESMDFAEEKDEEREDSEERSPSLPKERSPSLPKERSPSLPKESKGQIGRLYVP